MSISALQLAPDGSYFLGTADRQRDDGALYSKTFAFDVVTGKELWQQDYGAFGFSRTGPLAALRSADGRVPLFELPAKRLLCTSPPGATTIGPGHRLALGGARKIGEDSLGVTVFQFHRPDC